MTYLTTTAMARAMAAKPRGVFAAPRAHGDDPRALIEQINVAITELRATTDQRLADQDVVLANKLEAINATISELSRASEQQAQALAAARLGGGGNGITAEQRAHAEAFDGWFRRGREPDAGMRQLEVNAGLTSQSDPDGGYMVPTEMDATIDRVLGTVSAMRNLATVINVGAATYSKLVNQGGTSSGWVGEEQSRPETTAPKLAQIAIPVNEIYSNPATTQTLLDDAMFDVAAWLASEVSIEFAEEEGAAFINGNGTNKPRGILSYGTVANAQYAWGKIGFIGTGTSGDFAASGPADALIALYFALKSGYRNNASWVMNDAVMLSVRQMKDGQGNYLWAAPTQPGEIPTILGKPVITDDNMDAKGANKFPIAFGDFKRAYTIVDKGGTRLMRDPYTNKPFVYFYTTKRVGGAVTNFEAVKLLKLA